MVKSKNNDNQKLTAAKSLARSNCLSAAQVKQIAEIFDNDYNRLAFVQAAYSNTTDKDNFYEVYNTFMYFSTVFRLHDYITEQKLKVESKVIVVEKPINKEMSFPQIKYPDYRRYFGKTGCTNILKNDDFIKLAQQIFNEKVEYRKISIANNLVRNKCFQAAQAIKIASLFKSENDRLNFLKKVHPKVYDQDNYSYAAQLFKEDKERQEIKKLLSPNVELIYAESSCKISNKEFQIIKNQIIKERFNNTKVNMTKQVLRSKKCFNTNQVIEIVKLFQHNDAKLNIAKYAYDYTIDKDNYYKVANALTYATSKEELLRYIKNK